MASGKRAVIFGSAPCESWAFLKEYLRGDEFIIAADGGRRQAEQAGLTVDWYVGDGDSGGSPEGLPSVVLPEEKDWTDLEAAVFHALRLGYDELLLTGCSGGRFDHYLSSCFLLEEISRRGAEALLVDGMNEIRFLSAGKVRVENSPPYHYLGLLPLDSVVKGVTLRGTKYPLDTHDIRRGSTLTVSNEILPGHQAEITIQEGSALLVRSVPEWEAASTGEKA